MDATRLGADVRLLRHRKGWTQSRLAAEAGVKRWIVAEIEAGRGDRQPARRIGAVVTAVGGYLSMRVLFHGEGLDRLRDRAHARLVEQLVALLIALGWTVEVEVSFNRYGDRGVIDVLAFHPRFGALLVIEVKTVVPDVGGMLATLRRVVDHDSTLRTSFPERNVAVRRWLRAPRTAMRGLLFLSDVDGADRRRRGGAPRGQSQGG
jgi:transcriptional regulator with XRE-family HTH domain